MTRKLTKFEEAFIELNRDKMNVDELAQEIKGVGKTKIVEYLDTHPKTSNNEVKPARNSDLIARTKGVTIMTEAASTLADETKTITQKKKNECIATTKTS